MKNKLKNLKIIFFLLIFLPIKYVWSMQFTPNKNESLSSQISKTTENDKLDAPLLKPASEELHEKKVVKADDSLQKAEPLKEIKNVTQKKELSDVKIEEKKFELNFENVALKNVLDYISEIFDVTFLPDDAVNDERKIKGVGDVKINFRSNRPFAKSQIWDFLDLILDIAGLARISMPGLPKNFYRITQVANANKANLPTFVGTNPDELPDYQRIRYLYFVQNRQASQIKDLIVRLQSKNSQVEVFQDLNVLIFTDSAYNIRTLMKIVHELDSAGLPEILSVIKLQNADAVDVAKLYESLKGKEGIFVPFQESVKRSRLTEATRVIAEPRTNAVIIFGPKESVQKLEEFIKKYVDKAVDNQTRRVHIYELNYAPAEQIANILNAATQFGADSEAAKFGGVRGGEKFLSRMYFEPEKQGNRLIIRGDPEDYKLIKKVIEELDQQQPQVAIEVFIVALDFENTKGLYSKIRNKTNETVNYQTSGAPFGPIQINTTTGSLISNLVNLATGADVGTTVVSLGKNSVWALLGALQSVTDSKIISNPFLVATNKYAATVSLGETRRVNTDQVVGGANVSVNAQGNVDANLSVTITPQINDFGIINLDVTITIDQFVTNDPLSPRYGDKTTRTIHTNTNVADKEVLALGGLIRNEYEVIETSVPLLGRIPLLGLLFKSKNTIITKQNLLVFISPRIIQSQQGLISTYTKNKSELAHEDLDYFDSFINSRDPVHKWFFQEPNMERRDMINEFMEGSASKEKDSGIYSKKLTNKKFNHDNARNISKGKSSRSSCSLMNCVKNNKRDVC